MEKIVFWPLVLCLILVCYLYWKAVKKSPSLDGEEKKPFDLVLVGWLALVFAFLTICLFSYLNELPVKEDVVRGNIGQIGDFIGGLLNPILSFLALLALLRTTQIQTEESRRSRIFMQSQQRLLELEKFENTFFHMMRQCEEYCERHLRGGGFKDSYGSRISSKVCARYEEFSKLEPREQILAAAAHVRDVTKSDICLTFIRLVVKILRFIDSSDQIDSNIRKTYARMLTDALNSKEWIIACSALYSRNENVTLLVRKWILIHLRSGRFACPEIEYFYSIDSDYISPYVE